MPISKAPAWSFAALAHWALAISAALVISGGLVFGPLLADQAWQRGVHVTPVQAAAHFAFLAEGMPHHHGAASSPSAHRPVRHEDGPSLQDGSSSLSLGSPIVPVAGRWGAFSPVVWAAALVETAANLPDQVASEVPSPPPRAA